VDEPITDRLRALIEKVLQYSSYRERAGYFQKVISKTRGLDMAADIIEQAFSDLLHQRLYTQRATVRPA
jgi:UDP:flavonoid glycosyltransferase YjiC (YdhE family)